MSVAPNFFQHSATLKTVSDLDKYGRRSFTTSTVKGKMMDKEIKQHTPDGDEVVFDTAFALSENTTVNPEDELVFDGQTYQVMAVKHAKKTVTTLGYKLLALQRKGKAS